MKSRTFTNRNESIPSDAPWHQKILGLMIICLCFISTTNINAQITLDAVVTDLSCTPAPCPEDSDGAIDLTISGGVEPYDIQWSLDGVELPTCEEPAFDELNGTGSLDLQDVDNTVVEDAIATRNYIIQGSVLTVNDASFNGGATIDEEIINNSQEPSIIGLRTGVDHPQIIGGPNAANMTRTFTFSPAVSNLRMFFNDLDNNDVVIVNPKLGGVTQTLTPSEYTIQDPTQVGLTGTDAQGNTSPNMFTSLVDQALNATTTGGIDFVFAGPVDEIEIIFYDDVAGPGVNGSEGGSYTVNFPGQCREDLACIEAGTYSVVVTDANGTTASAEYTILPATNCIPPVVEVTTSTIPCDETTGAIDVTVTSGTAPFAYYWETSEGEALPLPDPCTDRDWADLESLAGTGANPVVGGDNDIVENAINNSNFVIQGAAFTVQSSVFNGGATVDEEIINDSQLNGTFAIRTGVNHPQLVGGVGAANVTRTFTFDKPVCDLNMFLNDIDNNDVAIVNASLAGTPISLVAGTDFVLTGTNVNYVGGNQFESINDAPLGNTADGGVDFTFSQCVDEIEIIFYDNVAAPGVAGTEGGSYSVNFPPTCDYPEDQPELEEGCYRVIVFDAIGLSDTTEVCLEQEICSNVEISVETTPIPCGATTGAIDVTVTDGIAPFAYYWETSEGEALPLPDPCTDRDWADLESLAGTGANPVVGGDNDIVENAINNSNFVIQGAAFTVQSSVFNGGATVDEEIINDSQLNGTFAIRTGVNHPQLVGGVGAANVTRTFTFDKPVCDLNMFLNDIDNNDVAIVNASLAGTPISLVVGTDFVLTGTNVNYVGGNQFESINDAPLGNTADGGVDFTFSQCVDEIEIIFYDDVAAPGVAGTEGGSYSVNFPPTCDYPEDQPELEEGCYRLIVFDAIGSSDTTEVCLEKTPCSAIGNYVWYDENADGLQDAGEPGISGVTIQLIENGVVIATTTTDANGGYLFPDLSAGTYTVNVDNPTLPSGISQTTNPVLPGSDFGNQTDGYVIVLGDDEENLTADFGYIWEDPDGNQGTAAIGDRVWLDADSDGVQDAGEAGIGGVTVTVLFDSNGDGTVDSNDAPFPGAIDQNGNTGTGTTTTEPDGTYIFYNLPAGQYAIVVDGASTPLTGLTQTGDPDDYAAPATNPDNFGEPVVLAPGDVFLLMDFGYNDPSANDIGDTIYFDPNANGTQDPGEPGIEGVTVALFDANGDVIATTTTDENGNYLFPGLPDEPYTVVVTDTDNVLGDLVNSGDPDGGNDEMSSVPSLPSDNLDQDFGYTPPGQDPNEGLVGDTVFLDYNSDGVPDAGEGIEGVTVELLDGAGNVIGSTVTDENGNYYFPGLDPTATYSTMVDPTTLPPGIVQTVDPDGTLDGTSTTDLSQDADGIDLTLDYGYEPTPGSAGSIGNLVWLDNDVDGVNDGPNGPDGIPGTDDDEPGIEGVTIDLYQDTNGNGVVDAGEPLIASTVTDANGNYLFPNLPTNNGAGVDYIVDVTDEAGVLGGHWHSTGTPNTNDNSQMDTYAITLGGGNPVDNLTADFGYYVEPAKVGNRVWEDVTIDVNGNFTSATANGVQDPGEVGIPGIPITLNIQYPDGQSVTLVEVTDANGFYCFGNLLFDEDYTASNGPGQPIYTISAPTSAPSVILPISGQPADAMSPNNASANGTLDDSDDHAGTLAFTCQGWTDVSQQPDPNDEQPWGSYDFGYYPVNLPVELIYFKATESNCKAMLTWATATEKNVSHFNVEKSKDGINFETLGRVNAVGNSQTEQTYSLVDDRLDATNYYRLNIVDFDGSSDYSDIEIITTSCATGVSVSEVFPNPVQEAMSLRFNSNTNETIDIIVTDNMGRTVITQSNDIAEGINTLTIDVSSLPQAIYTIQMQGNGWISQPSSFVKMK